MRRIGRTFAGLAGLLLLVGTACESKPENGSATTQPAGSERTTAQEVKQKASEAVDAALAYAREKKEGYTKSAREELDKLNERMSELEKQVREAAEERRPELERRLEQLKQQTEFARRRFRQLSDASADAWEEMRRGMDEALKDLKQGLDEAGAPETQPTTTTAPAGAP